MSFGAWKIHQSNLSRNGDVNAMFLAQIFTVALKPKVHLCKHISVLLLTGGIL